MSDLATVEFLTKAISEAKRAASFCTSGVIPVLDPGLQVEQLGEIKFPASKKLVKALIAQCQVAPYGKGTRTLVDAKVRKTFELGPEQFQVSDDWNKAIALTTRAVAEELGLPPDQFEARPYKLLVYETGGFFLKHRDSEKHNRMVASLIVVLPHRFAGGELEVRHSGSESIFRFDEAAQGEAPCYAAFYADCEHEVQRVTNGTRVCLTYNLVLKSERKTQVAHAPAAAPDDVLAESLASWINAQPAEPLVFALEHHYTQRGLSLDLLKGGDRQLADLVTAAASKADCLVHLAQVSRHLLQFADDGSFERSYSRRYSREFAAPRQKLQIGETYEDDLTGDKWTDLSGKKQLWGAIAFDRSSIVSAVPLDAWEPTSEEFEGYTGNAGNTLDRWYHRSAIVVWRREQHFQVVTKCGATECVPLLQSLVGKLKKTPQKRQVEAKVECAQLARAIMDQWPNQGLAYYPRTTETDSPLAEFPELLLALHNRDLVAKFLTIVAERDQETKLKQLIVATCREFGSTAIAAELKQLLATKSNRRGRDELLPRDVEWLAALCCDAADDIKKQTLARQLCKIAVDRFCEPFTPQLNPVDPRHARYRREPSLSEKALLPLLKAIVAGGAQDDLARVLAFVQEAPSEFRLDECQVPCLNAIIPWSRKKFGKTPAEIAHWLATVRQRLSDVTRHQPEPPADWVRPAEVACKCQLCGQLNTFLADARNEFGRIAAREDLRRHLLDKIDRHLCDVKHTLDRSRSPFALVFTKTTGSYERALKQYESDCRLLQSLPATE